MTREKREHMIQEPAARIDYGYAPSVQIDADLYIGFIGFSYDFRRSHGVASRSTSCVFSMNARISSIVPIVTRIYGAVRAALK